MLRLRCCIPTQLLSSSSAFPVSPLHRLLSAAAAPCISPNPSFAVEEYLADTCGLTRPQALKASAKLSHLKSPSNPDAVLAFLAGIGFSGADVAALVARDPLFLCARVEKTLAPIFLELTALGLSRSEIVRLVSKTASGGHFRCRYAVSKLHYHLALFGSAESLLRALKGGFCFLAADLERVVKPNVTFLQECGLGACEIAKLFTRVPRMLTAKPERVQKMVACAEGLGVPRGSGMFRAALEAVAFIREEKIAAQVVYLKNTFRWSDAEVGIAMSRYPFVLRRSKESLQLKSEFLFCEVGLEPVYITQRPVMLGLSLDARLRPRYYVIKFLKANGFLDRDVNYWTIFTRVEKVFMEKYICPHMEAAPHLAEDYAAACRGEMPTSFKFT